MEIDLFRRLLRAVNLSRSAPYGSDPIDPEPLLQSRKSRKVVKGESRQATSGTPAMAAHFRSRDRRASLSATVPARSFTARSNGLALKETQASR